MRLLLDTCTVLWLLGDDRRLSGAATTALLDAANERWLSPISLLEIALKVRLRKLPLPRPYSALFPAELLANDIQLLPLEPRHIEPLTKIPLHHKDPFDRLIAATAVVEGMTLVSADAAFDAYGLPASGERGVCLPASNTGLAETYVLASFSQMANRTVFLGLLDADDKPAALARAVCCASFYLTGIGGESLDLRGRPDPA